MKTPHTRGPWQLSNATSAGRFVGSGPDGVLGIAMAFGDSPDEQDANARLIAAAPDLLDACIRITTWLDKLAGIAEEAAKDKRFITLSEAHAADSKNFRSTSADIKKVIAKAEGAR